ncbi:MAG: S1 RNA-binding domain-containing protein [Acidobacteria bacterium]|nr:S1 RNA-binding domain-containing protein [Acidobacteriota bacterium]
MPQTSSSPSLAETAESADRRAFEDALAAEGSGKKKLAEGQLVSGIIAGITPDVVLVSIGAKSDAIMDRSELDGEKVGDRIEAIVMKAGPDVRISRKLAAARRSKAELRVASEARIPVSGKVLSRNKGGFDIGLGGSTGLKAFCPVSQIDVGRHDEPALAAYVGQTFDFRILEYSEDGRRVVVSRVALLKEANDESASKVKEQIVPGAVLTGRVRSITDFGAFVDLGGVEGLVHVTEISRKRVAHPKDVLAAGQEVTVKVTKVEQDGKRISLSMKELEKDPWEGIDQRLAPGTTFTAKVARQAEFGLFVEIEPGVDGLVHVSQLPPGISVKDPSVAAGQMITGWIREVDMNARRLSLTMRESSSRDPWEGIDARIAEGGVTHGTVENVAVFGVFVKLDEGLTGLIPNSETGLPHGIPASKTFTPGQKVEVKIIGIDKERKRISLSVSGAKDEAERGEVRKYREESAKREKSEAQVSGFGASLLAALTTKKGK